MRVMKIMVRAVVVFVMTIRSYGSYSEGDASVMAVDNNDDEESKA